MEQRIYRNQDVKLIIPISESITDATSIIRARKPNGSLIEYNISSVADDGKSAILFWKPTDSGQWRFWLYTIWPDGSKTPSNPVNVHVYPEGT